jgi:hypothetical protein
MTDNYNFDESYSNNQNDAAEIPDEEYQSVNDRENN